MKKLTCLICLVPVLALSQTAQTALNSAISQGYGSVSSGDLNSIIAYGVISPVGIGSAQTALSLAVSNSYGALSPNDLQILQAYGAVTGGAGASGVVKNSYSTNTQTAADLYVVGLIGGPTNGVSSNTCVTIVKSIVQQNRWTTNADATVINGGNLTNLNATKLNGIIPVANLSAFYDPTNAALNATNGMTTLTYTNPATVVYTNQLAATSNGIVAQIPSLTAYATLSNVSTTNTANLTITTNIVNASTNGYPWGALYAPVTSSSLNSFTTNFTIPTYQTNWTIVLPNVATNYQVQASWALVAKVANPHGVVLPLGSKVADVEGGTLFPSHPYALIDQGDGKMFVLSMDGDKANFLDNTGQAFSFQQSFVADSFNLQANFIWSVKK